MLFRYQVSLITLMLLAGGSFASAASGWGGLIWPKASSGQRCESAFSAANGTSGPVLDQAPGRNVEVRKVDRPLDGTPAGFPFTIGVYHARVRLLEFLQDGRLIHRMRLTIPFSFDYDGDLQRQTQLLEALKAVPTFWLKALREIRVNPQRLVYLNPLPLFVHGESSPLTQATAMASLIDVYPGFFNDTEDAAERGAVFKRQMAHLICFAMLNEVQFKNLAEDYRNAIIADGNSVSGESRLSWMDDFAGAAILYAQSFGTDMKERALYPNRFQILDEIHRFLRKL